MFDRTPCRFTTSFGAIANATVTEGNAGTSELAFTVTLSAATSGPVTVGYATTTAAKGGERVFNAVFCGAFVLAGLLLVYSGWRRGQREGHRRPEQAEGAEHQGLISRAPL